MGVNGGPNIVTDGLVLHLDAANLKSYPGSGTVWKDLSGGGFNSDLINSPTYETENGGGIILNGTNQFCEQNISGNFLSNPSLNGMVLTVSFWCKTFGGYYIISSGGQTGSTGISFSYQNGAPFYVVKGETLSFMGTLSPSLFDLGNYVNWAITCDGTNVALFKNGNLLQSSPLVADSQTDAFTDLTFGVPNNHKNNYHAQVTMSNFSSYNKALTPSEILQNFRATRSRFGL